jgi:hypothetical protein
MSAVSDIAILSRLLDAGEEPLSPEAARSILALRFTEEDRLKMDLLAAKARAGTLTAERRQEADSYERAGEMLALLKSKARRTLRSTPGLADKP